MGKTRRAHRVRMVQVVGAAAAVLSWLVWLGGAASVAAAAQPMLADRVVFRTPQTYETADFTADPVEGGTLSALFFDGLPWHGNPTRVFAWVGVPEVEEGQKVPAMVLVHGAGQSASAEWVRLWNERGYAAIAMDTCGQVPRRADPQGPRGRGGFVRWERHEQAGPPGWGGFGQVDEPPEDQWVYHAVSDIILAHSLIRSMPEVDADRVGLTGVSWGGALTCIAAALDDRFRMAAPVYGCGFLGDDSAWLGEFERMGPENAQKWLAMWDPSHYLRRIHMPMLWVAGTNDVAFPLDSLQKSYRLPRGPLTLSVTPRQVRGHDEQGEKAEEIHAFAEAVFRHGTPLPRVRRQGHSDDRAWADYDARTPVAKAELVLTRYDVRWPRRRWETVPATLDKEERRVTATLPPGTKVYFLNLIDHRGLVVSSEHVDLDAEGAGQ